MKTNTLFLGSAMVLALAASGASFAADSTPAPTDPATLRAQHRAETAGMTVEERAAYRAKKQAEMTVEQRAAMRASAGGGNKGGKGAGIKARDGSGTGKMRGASGTRGGGMGQGAGR
ncbi:MAG: hypothetical protein PHQ60_13740 [Sideroxydans sp.]|nr:hypothetical protein [Sideroxydans sp.]